MRRPCTYTEPRKYVQACKGWLLNISMLGSATFYFVETPEGEIIRLQEAYTELKLLPEGEEDAPDDQAG